MKLRQRRLVSIALLLFGACSTQADEAATLEVLREFDVKFAVDGNLPNTPVVSISLAGPKVTDAAVAQLVNFPKLQKLLLSKTSATGETLADLRNLPELKELEVTVDAMTDRGFQAISKLKSLEILRIDGRLPRKLTLAAFQDFDQLDKLKTLIIDEDGFQGKAFDKLAGLDSLERLTLNSRGRLEKIEWEGIRRLTKLRNLTINYTEFEDPALPGIKDFHNLTSLILSHCQLSDAAAAEIGELKALKGLEISGKKWTDAGMKHLAGMPGLRSLGIRCERVTDAGIAHLAALKELRALHLRESSVSATGIQQLQRELPQLKIMR